MAKVALLVGVSEYEPELNPLPAAVKDVEAMRRVLAASELGGFDEVKVLTNLDSQTMQYEIETLFSGRSKDDLVLLFFSGHGIKDDSGRLYFATRNTRKNAKNELIRSTAVPASFVHEVMNGSRARRQAVILDCCFSGAFDPALIARDDSSVDLQGQLGAEGRIVLTSSSSTQYSFEQQGIDLSIYTRYLVEGIETGAGDRNEDGKVSMRELHDYAVSKVQETAPNMTPKMITLKDMGFEIVLAKAKIADPNLSYRRQVERYASRGEISNVGRTILDALRTQLDLSTEEAIAIEDEVLRPYRERVGNLQRYRQAFVAASEHEYPLSSATQAELRDLCEILGLRRDDISLIEAEETAKQTAVAREAYVEKLQRYEQEFQKALRAEYPVSEYVRSGLLNFKQSLELKDEDVKQIEARVTGAVEEYYRKLDQYRQAFADAVRQEYPLNANQQNGLQLRRQNLELRDVDVASVEAQITTEIESYRQRLQQYEQEFVSATQRKYYLNEITRKQLQQKRQTLDLSATDVSEIETQITAQIERYQINLGQYAQEFADATQQQYPLSQARLQALRQRQQSLNLANEDIALIEQRIRTEVEANLQKLKQYEQVFTESVQYENPISVATREKLMQLQRNLELSNESVAQIESQVLLTVVTNETQNQENSQPLNFSPPPVQPEYRIENSSQASAAPQGSRTPSVSTNRTLSRVGREARAVVGCLMLLLGAVWSFYYVLIFFDLITASFDKVTVLLFLAIGAGLTWVGVVLLRRK